MTSINSVHASSLRQAAAPAAPRASEPKTFTRKTEGAGAVFAGKDKARISPEAVAREIDSMFPNEGRYFFRYGNDDRASVQRFSTGLLQITYASDYIVKIKDGVIVQDTLEPSDDMGALLTAAKNAQ